MCEGSETQSLSIITNQLQTQQLQHKEGAIGRRDGAVRRGRVDMKAERRILGGDKRDQQKNGGRWRQRGMKYIYTDEQNRVMVSLLKLKCS